MPGGAVITGQECDSDLTVTVQLQTPLLFWRERSRWMWHKKWTLPRIFVSVDVGAGVPLDRPLFAMISCGTVVAGDSELHDQVRPALPPFPLGPGRPPVPPHATQPVPRQARSPHLSLCLFESHQHHCFLPQGLSGNCVQRLTASWGAR